MKDFFFLVLGLAIIFGSVFLFLNQRVDRGGGDRVIKIGENSFKVEIADTDEERALGLSGRTNLSEGSGVLFVLETTGRYGFWMKDMNFSIDIIWIDENFRITGIEKNVLPETYPEVFYPNEAIKYVLELPAGSSDKYRIDIGAVIQ